MAIHVIVTMIRLTIILCILTRPSTLFLVKLGSFLGSIGIIQWYIKVTVHFHRIFSKVYVILRNQVLLHGKIKCIGLLVIKESSTQFFILIKIDTCEIMKQIVVILVIGIVVTQIT